MPAKMGDDVTSSVDPLQDMSKHADIPPEDLRIMVEVFQKYPRLWEYFKNIVHAVDLLTTKSQADEELVRGLAKIDGYFSRHSVQRDALVHFTTVSGFIEKSVSFARQILRGIGKTYVTELPSEIDGKVDVGYACLLYIRRYILSCTEFSSKCCLRLAKTGYLHDLVEDVKHIQYMSADALEECNVFLSCLGTMQNCCMYPESAEAVRQLDIVPHLTPFLTKRGRTRFVSATAMAVLANVLEEDNLDILVLDGELLQYFLDHIMSAIALNKQYSAQWYIYEILFHFCLLAKTDFNRRLMVAQGTLPILRSVLDPSKERSEEEKNHAMTLISRLMEDQVNLQICQNYPELIEILKDLGRNGARETVEKVRDVLGKLEHCNRDLDDRIPAFPHVAQLLADQYNLLSILHMGLVEFVLDELKTFTGEQGTKTAAHGDEASCQQVLLALTKLADDHVYRREIMSRGGLDMLKTVLKTGSSEEKTEVAKAVLGLTMAPENRQVIKINTDLTTLLEDSKHRADNPDLVQLADNILVALYQ